MPKRRPRTGHKPRVEQPAAAVSMDTPAAPDALPPAPNTPPAPATAEPIMPSPTLARAVGEVLAHTARRVAVEQAPPLPPPAVPSGWLAAALGSWLVVAWLLLTTPAIARGPEERPWQPAAAQREASLRYGLWLAHDRVEGFRRDNGRLPSFLAEAGVTDTTLSLVVAGERDYTIEGRDGSMQLALGSAMAADSFLGSSLRLLRNE